MNNGRTPQGRGGGDPPGPADGQTGQTFPEHHEPGLG